MCTFVCLFIVIVKKNQVYIHVVATCIVSITLNRMERERGSSNNNNNKIPHLYLSCLISWQTYLGVNGVIGCSATMKLQLPVYISSYEWHIVLVSICLLARLFAYDFMLVHFSQSVSQLVSQSKPISSVKNGMKCNQDSTVYNKQQNILLIFRLYL